MTPELFIKKICRDIIADSLEVYKDLFDNTKLESATDPYWQRVLPFYSRLSESEKELFLQVIRQIMVDTVSDFLGTIDGADVSDGSEEEVSLLLARSHVKISGGLQEIFLEMEETGEV